jgi:transposase
MHSKHYSKQLEKRQRITGHTLVIGMDIGNEFNAACFLDKEGNVLGRYPTIYNSRKGFDYFYTMATKTKRKHKFTDVLIGMEPPATTGGRSPSSPRKKAMRCASSARRQ